MSKRGAASKNTNPNKKTKRAEFVWSDDECELLLNVTHDYKIQQLMNGTDWESVRSKYSDILELYKKEIPEPEESSRLLKDYPHKKEEITKEVLTAKLKAIRTKFRQVCVCLSVCLSVCVCQFDWGLFLVGVGCGFRKAKWPR